MEVAKAWILSPTGRKSGVLWSDLTGVERQFYKKMYLKFKSQQLNDQTLGDKASQGLARKSMSKRGI